MLGGRQPVQSAGWEAAGEGGPGMSLDVLVIPCRRQYTGSTGAYQLIKY